MTVSDSEKANLLATAPGAVATDTLSDLRMKKYKAAIAGLTSVSDFEKRYIENAITTEVASDCLYDLRRKYYTAQGINGTGLSTDDMHALLEAGSTVPLPSVVGNTQAVDAAATSVLTPVLPSGLQAGDRLYLMMMSSDTSVGAAVTPTLNGWTALIALADVGTAQRAVYQVDYTPGLQPVVWNSAAARRMGYACVAIRNRVAAAVTGAANAASSTTTVDAPSVAATGSGVAVRMFCRKDNLSTGVTLPAGHTLIGQAIGGGTGPAVHMMTCQAPVAAAGATGAATATFTVATLNSTGFTAALA